MQDKVMTWIFAAGLWLLLWLYYRWLERDARREARERLHERQEARREAERAGSTPLTESVRWVQTYPPEGAGAECHFSVSSRYKQETSEKGTTSPKPY